MKVIKRSGEEAIFNVSKIENAIRKANKATTHNQLTQPQRPPSAVLMHRPVLCPGTADP